MRVINQAGREMEVTREEYDKLVGMGVKLHILSRELEEIKETDSYVYTAICGEYPVKRNDIKVFGDEGIFKRSVMEAKRYKILPHKFFDNEITIWVDGNIFLEAKPDYIVSKFLKDCDIALFGHPYRENVYDEFAELKKDPRFADAWLQEGLNAQEKHYRQEGLPPVRLFEGNFLIRRNNEKVNRIMDAWWAEITRWQWRDQVSLPYVLWKYGKGVELNIIKGNIRENKFFKHIEMYG